jgi:hypothetical protein
MSNAMIASTGAGRLTEAWTTLRAHGIKLDGCDLPNAKILAIAAIADGKDSPAVAQASQVKAA